MTTQKIFKWFWTWEDEKEETWLREMAQKGWHLREIQLLNRYTFESGAPGEVAYRLDFMTNPKDKQGYLQLFQDAGWEYVLEYGSWQYFRKAVTAGEAPEIFTDNESKAQKYQRILPILVIFVVVLSPALSTPDLLTRYGWFGAVAYGLRFLIFLLMLISLLMLIRRLGQLKKKL